MVRDRQSLRFKDRATGVDVTLVGTMHYNPVSIELASSTVTRLREADALHAVVLESCPADGRRRRRRAPGSFLRWFLYNEMLAAANAASDPTKIRLGDQRIEDLGACARRTIVDTTRDVLNPLGGWGRLVRDWRDGFDREINGRGTRAVTCARRTCGATRPALRHAREHVQVSDGVGDQVSQGDRAVRGVRVGDRAIPTLVRPGGSTPSPART